MLPPWSRTEILAEVVEPPRRAYVELPDLRVIERPGWQQIITPSFRHGGFNEVSLCVLDEREADAVIDATIAEYRALGCRFVWRVGPGSAPADLADRLERRGLERNLARGMARSTAIAAPAGSGTRVIEIDASTIDLYTRTMATGWSTDPAPLARAHDVMLATSSVHHLFLAYCGDEPAAAAGYVRFERSAYLLGGVVLPAFRRRGLYTALVRARLGHAAARGIALATTHARAQTSAPILERLGFETICDYQMFRG